jgi:hypothetical protein
MKEFGRGSDAYDPHTRSAECTHIGGHDAVPLMGSLSNQALRRTQFRANYFFSLFLHG